MPSLLLDEHECELESKIDEPLDVWHSSRHIENSIQGQKTEEFLPELGEGLVIETGGGDAQVGSQLILLRISI